MEVVFLNRAVEVVEEDPSQEEEEGVVGVLLRGVGEEAEGENRHLAGEAGLEEQRLVRMEGEAGEEEPWLRQVEEEVAVGVVAPSPQDLQEQANKRVRPHSGPVWQEQAPGHTPLQ